MKANYKRDCQDLNSINNKTIELSRLLGECAIDSQQLRKLLEKYKETSELFNKETLLFEDLNKEAELILK